MKVLVTGANGFVGRPTAQAIAERGHELLAPASRHSAPANGLELLAAEAVEAYLRQHQPEGLIHLAWDTTHGAYWETPANLIWTAASLRLLEAFARHGGKRAVIAGTSAEYCWQSNESLCESTTPLEPDSLYGVSKDSLRRTLEAWAPAAGLSLAWGRIFCPYGPNEKASRLIPKLITKLESGETIPFDSGNLIRDFLHTEELGHALAALFDSSYEGAINLASGEDLSIRGILLIVGESLGRSDQIQFDQLPDPEGQPLRVVASIDRLKSDLGWAPSKSNPERLNETCSWWRDHLAATKTA